MRKDSSRLLIQFLVTVIFIFGANISLANCLYGNCVQGLGVQIIKKFSQARSTINNDETYIGEFTDGM